MFLFRYVIAVDYVLSSHSVSVPDTLVGLTDVVGRINEVGVPNIMNDLTGGPDTSQLLSSQQSATSASDAGAAVNNSPRN